MQRPPAVRPGSLGRQWAREDIPGIRGSRRPGSMLAAARAVYPVRGARWSADTESLGSKKWCCRKGLNFRPLPYQRSVNRS